MKFFKKQKRIGYEYNLLEISEYIIYYMNMKTSYDINASKLQRLMYLCYGLYYGITGKVLFDAIFIQYPTGPHISELNDCYKKYGSRNILYENHKPIISVEDKQIINAIIERYSSDTSKELSLLIFDHTPQVVTRLKMDAYRNKKNKKDEEVFSSMYGGNDIINNELIKAYFKKLI